jgi:hypothetical protein
MFERVVLYSFAFHRFFRLASEVLCSELKSDSRVALIYVKIAYYGVYCIAGMSTFRSKATYSCVVQVSLSYSAEAVMS